MGGRGGASGFDTGTSTGADRKSGAKFYDRTAQFEGMTLHEFENAIRDKKTEYIGLFDKEGKLIVAGTSGQKGSVAVPTGHPEFSKTVTLTHNHPSAHGRGIGGTFSEADVINHAWLQVKGAAPSLQQTRAVASGKGENTYIMRNGAKANVNHLLQTAQLIDKSNTMSKTGNKVLDAVKATVALKYGKTLSSVEQNMVYLGALKRIWKDRASKSGFDYIEVKKSRW